MSPIDRHRYPSDLNGRFDRLKPSKSHIENVACIIETFLHTNRKAYVSYNSAVVSKMNYFSRSEAVTFTAKVVTCSMTERQVFPNAILRARFLIDLEHRAAPLR